MYIAAGILLAEIAGPFVKRWWDAGASDREDRAGPRALAQEEHKAALDAGPLALNQAKFIASTLGVEIAVLDPKITMTSAEWAARYRAMVAAGDFEEEQRRILSNARIEAGDRAVQAGGAQSS